jgi:hypothetical protein
MELSWIDTMVHQNLRFWETGAPMPRDKASLKHWSRFDADNGSTLEQELFPISATITGNIAVVQYKYMIARENNKKERETVTGHYTDVLVKDGGRWLFPGLGGRAQECVRLHRCLLGYRLHQGPCALQQADTRHSRRRRTTRSCRSMHPRAR